MSYRVVQWATGNQGVEAIRAILDRPDLDLVGAKVYSDDKEESMPVSWPAGSRAGCRPRRTSMRSWPWGRLRRLLPPAHLARRGLPDPGQRRQCHHHRLPVPPAVPTGRRPRPARGGLCGGELVGSRHRAQSRNLSGVLPLALSGMSRSIEKVTLQERADWSFYESTHITFDNMRFGRPPEEVTEDASDFLKFNSGIFQEEVALIGEAPGAGLDQITSSVRWRWSRGRDPGIRWPPAPWRAERWHWQGLRAGSVLVEIETLWTVGGEYPTHWPTPLDGWTLTLEGEPSIRAHLLTLMSYERPLPIAEHVRAASVATAMQADQRHSGPLRGPGRGADHGRPAA